MQITHLTLPPSLDVERDHEQERRLYDQARTWLEREAREEGVHASDLLFPRKAYWRQVDPKPLDERQIGLFLVGKVLHAFILGHDDLTADEGSVYSEPLGIWYSPDKRAPLTEIKTSRSFYEPKTLSDLETYLHQLLIYMVAEGVAEGHLWVLYLNAKDATGRTSPAFRAYRVRVEPDELEATKLECRRLRDLITDAVKDRRHHDLPLCPEWACSPKECPWWARCQPDGRYGNTKYLQRRGVT